jgi:hypothetical protein
MFQEMFSDGLTRVPTVFHPIIFNLMWHILTGQRLSIEEHGKARYFAEQAIRMARSVDATGDALAQTPWIRFIAPYYSGFTNLMDSSHNTLKYMEVISCLDTLEE